MKSDLGFEEKLSLMDTNTSSDTGQSVTGCTIDHGQERKSIDPLTLLNACIRLQKTAAAATTTTPKSQQSRPRLELLLSLADGPGCAGFVCVFGAVVVLDELKLINPRVDLIGSFV